MRDSIQIEEMAAGWLARRDRGDWCEADQAELTAWLDSSTAYRIAYVRLEVAWQQARRLRALAVGLSPGEIPPPRDWQCLTIPCRRQLPAVSDDPLPLSTSSELTKQ